MTAPRRFPLGNLRSRLMLLVVLTLLPLVVVFLIQASRARADGTDEAQADTLRLSSLVAERAASSISEAQALLEGFAGQAGDAADPNRCTALLMELDNGLETITNALLIGPDGKVVCDADGTATGADLSDRSYVQEAREEDAFAVGLEPPGVLGRSTQLVVVKPAEQPTGALIGVVLDLGRDLPPLL